MCLQALNTHHLTVLTDLFLFLVAGEKWQLLAKDLLLVQYLLVVHVLQQVRVVNAVGTKELGVGDLERLANRLGYQLSLQHNTCPSRLHHDYRGVARNLFRRGQKRAFRPQRGAPDRVWGKVIRNPPKHAENSIECHKFCTCLENKNFNFEGDMSPFPTPLHD